MQLERGAWKQEARWLERVIVCQQSSPINCYGHFLELTPNDTTSQRNGFAASSISDARVFTVSYLLPSRVD